MQRLFGVLAVVVCGIFAMPQARAADVVEKQKELPGVALARGITEITGVAISPLLGVSGLGAWRYFQTPAAARNDLPWYCQPWAWGTGLTVLGLIFLKDTVGVTLPGILKKPFDIAELFENKASALVAAAAFVPLVTSEIARDGGGMQVPAGAIGTGWTGVIDFWWLAVPAGLAAFAVVWVCSHAVNVLIVLSPFSLVDAALKLMRAAVLATLGTAYLISPWLGAGLCLLVVAVAAWFAPAALRLTIFGTRFAGDIVLWPRARRRATPERPHVFTMTRIGGLPRRMGGRIVPGADGGLEFRYKRFGFLPERGVPLEIQDREVAKGLLSPSVFEGDRKIFVFLPRYRGREEEIAGKLRLGGVREHGLVRGWLALKSWWSRDRAPEKIGA